MPLCLFLYCLSGQSREPRADVAVDRLGRSVVHFTHLADSVLPAQAGCPCWPAAIDIAYLFTVHFRIDVLNRMSDFQNRARQLHVDFDGLGLHINYHLADD